MSNAELSVERYGTEHLYCVIFIGNFWIICLGEVIIASMVKSIGDSGTTCEEVGV